MAQPALAEMNLEREMRRHRSPFIVSGEPEPAPMPAADAWAYDEGKILWLELPPNLAPVARLGVVATACGAIFVLRVRDETSPEVERGIEGYPSDMLDLAWALSNGVGLIHGLSGDPAHDASILAETRMVRGG